MAIGTRKLGKVCVFDMHGNLTIGTADVELRKKFRREMSEAQSQTRAPLLLLMLMLLLN